MITDEQYSIAGYIDDMWPGKFRVSLGERLAQLFPEPSNIGLRHIWKYGEADIAVYRKKRLVAIIEPGGSHHFDEKQAKNDRRKWKLADINGVTCLMLMNGLQPQLSNRKWRSLIGRALFGVLGQKTSGNRTKTKVEGCLSDAK